jgi:hypothetical protein
MSHLFPSPTLELPGNIEYLPSINGGLRHRLAGSVRHRNSAIAQAFHDLGRGIVHAGLDAPAATATSSRVCSYFAGDVRVEGAAVGFGILGGTWSTPMLTCGIVQLPIGHASGSEISSVVVGMHPDYDYAVAREGARRRMFWGTILNVGLIGVTVLAMFAGASLVPATGAAAVVVGGNLVENAVQTALTEAALEFSGIGNFDERHVVETRSARRAAAQQQAESQMGPLLGGR